MSEVQTGQCMLAARLSKIDLDSLVVVGDDVGTVPAHASGSMKPRTIKRAFALGVPSGFFGQSVIVLSERLFLSFLKALTCRCFVILPI